MRLALLAILVVLPACGGQAQEPIAAGSVSDPKRDVPLEFADACGKPGSRVTVEERAAVIRKADCDLTGVTLQAVGYGGAVVPPPGRSVEHSGGFAMSTTETGDVSYRLVGSGDSNG